MSFLHNISAPFLISLFSFLTGSAIGSFLSVLVNRLHLQEQGIIFGKSHCPKCHHQLKAINLIPLLSYLWQAGKCRYCRRAISIEYFLLELFTGLIFAGGGWFLLTQLPSANFIQISLWGLILGNLIALIYSDLKYQEVSNLFLITNLFLFLAAIWLSPIDFFTKMPIDFWSQLAGMGIIGLFFGMQIVLSRGRWLGLGDLLFALPIGFYLGWHSTLVWLVLTYFLGGLCGVVLLLAKRAGKQTSIAFLPFLGIALLPAVLWGERLFNWYFNF